MTLSWLKSGQAVVAAIVLQSSCSAAEPETPKVLSNNPDCAELRPGPNPKRVRWGCSVAAVIIDAEKDRRITCRLSISAEYEENLGGPAGYPAPMIIHGVPAPGFSESICFIQPGLGAASKSIFPLDSVPPIPLSDPSSRAHLHVIYDGVSVILCMTPTKHDGYSEVYAETACSAATIAGTFR